MSPHSVCPCLVCGLPHPQPINVTHANPLHTRMQTYMPLTSHSLPSQPPLRIGCIPLNCTALVGTTEHTSASSTRGPTDKWQKKYHGTTGGMRQTQPTGSRSTTGNTDSMAEYQKAATLQLNHMQTNPFHSLFSYSECMLVPTADSCWALETPLRLCTYIQSRARQIKQVLSLSSPKDN